MSPVVLLPLQSGSQGSTFLKSYSYRPINGLNILIEGTSGEVEGKVYSYQFAHRTVRGFAMLDEGDLIAIWESKSYKPNSSPIFEIKEGSIFEGLSERSGILSVSVPFEKLEDLKEYLITSQDECVLILSTKPPKITESKA